MRRTAPVQSSKIVSRKERRLSRHITVHIEASESKGVRRARTTNSVRISFGITNAMESNAVLARGVVALQSNEFAVQPGLIHQFVVCAKLGDLSALHYDDAVRSANGRETVGHDE